MVQSPKGCTVAFSRAQSSIRKWKVIKSFDFAVFTSYVLVLLKISALIDWCMWPCKAPKRVFCGWNVVQILGAGFSIKGKLSVMPLYLCNVEEQVMRFKRRMNENGGKRNSGSFLWCLMGSEYC